MKIRALFHQTILLQAVFSVFGPKMIPKICPYFRTLLCKAQQDPCALNVKSVPKDFATITSSKDIWLFIPKKKIMCASCVIKAMASLIT